MLNLDRADRRRVVAASVVSLVALPSLWLMSRDDPTAPATVVGSGVVVGPESSDEPAGADAARSYVASSSEALGSAGGAFLVQPEVAPERPDTAGEPVTVAVPARSSAPSATGRATYRSTVPGESICLVTAAPFNARVTVTNVDNGRSITCVASMSPVGSRDDIVLHTASFTQIADLTDAPVPVELSW